MRSPSPAAIAARSASRRAASFSTSGTTSALLSRRMSRHIAGLDAATRVVSRRLDVGRRSSAAHDLGVEARRARPRACRRRRAAGGCPRPDAIVQRRVHAHGLGAHGASTAPRSSRRPPRGVRADGQITQRLPSNSSGLAASGPMRSVPAIGWQATKAPCGRWRSTSRMAARLDAADVEDDRARLAARARCRARPRRGCARASRARRAPRRARPRRASARRDR